MIPNSPLSILFVCLGNICRSPLAEAILRHRLTETHMNANVYIDSAGTGDWHTGRSADDRSISVARRNGITLDSNARQVIPEDFHIFDYILAMDRQNQQDLEALKILHGGKAIIKLFLEFDVADKSVLDVPDPYYGGTEGFQHLFQMLDKTCLLIINQLVDETMP